MDLSLLALAGNGLAQMPALPELANFKVESALSWYAEHLASSPSVKEAADAVHVSTSHLRRLFWQVRRTSPKAAFQRIRLDRAQELMSRTALTLEDVARHCGYVSSSHFCREYRAFHNFTPTHWRKKLIGRFIKPLPPGVTFTRTFSARPHERMMPA
jgi:AraC family transcriptional regulator